MVLMELSCGQVYSKIIDKQTVRTEIVSLFATGGRSTVVHAGMTEPYIRKGDVIGCALDLTVPIMNFYLNGVKVKGNFKNMNLDGMFFPVVSCSARVR